ncbi:MAG: SRPBCC family protein [Thermoplasmatota archaeon]
MTQLETHSVRLERTINAPLAKVRQALIDPAVLVQWYAPGDMTATVHACDARVGGQFEIAMHGKDPHGEVSTHTAHGEFTRVDDDVVAMTFNWTEHEMPGMTEVRYDLSEVDGATRLVLTHTGLPTRELAQNHEEGWTGCLAKLPGACE